MRSRARSASRPPRPSRFSTSSRDRLRDEHVLLILDNFEQVTAAAPTVAHLLQDCPRLKLLVTSREALHVSGEHLFAVPPLSLPEAVRGQRSAEQLAGYEAIQLFVERAQAVKPDFRLTDDNAAAVAEICLRLDGLPLALELATARINLFSPEALLERLDSSLQLLRSGPRDRPERQQTLRAAIEWSYELLEPGEQRLFELLAAFSGATFDAVEAVAATLNGRPRPRHPRRPRLARRQEPRAPGRRERRLPLRDAGDDQGVRGRAPPRKAPSSMPPPAARTPRTSRTSRAGNGRASPATAATRPSPR